MLKQNERFEIDHRTMKLIVGAIAFTLPLFTSLSSPDPLTSISESHHIGGLTQDIFVGFLFAIASFLAAYNGQWRIEKWMSKFAAVAGLLVALVPCKCQCTDEVLPYVHAGAAAVMFSVLAGFCGIFWRRALDRKYAVARRRAWIYAFCGLAILGSMALCGLQEIDAAKNVLPFLKCPRLIYWCETVGLGAFGFSWLVASKILPGLGLPEERPWYQGPAKQA